MKKYLLIDCSCGMNIYLHNGKQVFSHLDENQKRHTDDLLVAVDGLLNNAGMKISEIENFCVCIGPGSFTGIRVAISMIKGLCVNLNAQVCVASNFDAFEIKKDENSVCLLEGFSNFLYARFCVDGKASDECIDVNDLKQRIINENLSVYVLSEKTQNVLNKNEIDSKIIENAIISCFEGKIEKGDFVELNQISPVYLRASQAEIERNKRLNK